MLLHVEELAAEVPTEQGRFRAVDRVSFELDAGRTLALVGESGCGKSLTALSLLGLLPPGVRRVSGRIGFADRDLTALPPATWRQIRGREIALIFQDSLSSLNPLIRVGAQIAEPLRLHRGWSARRAQTRAIELLEQVGLPDPTRRARAYPHQLSGGQRQRVMIAMALACEPRLLVADEPTTALDPTIQAQILRLLADLQSRNGMSILFITHDLAVVAQVAHEACVMYAGRIVERAPVPQLFYDPRHPYTQGLLRANPGSHTPDSAGRQRLPAIPGEVPTPATRPAGCPFRPRCPRGGAEPQCAAADPPLRTVAEQHACACWFAPGHDAAS